MCAACVSTIYFIQYFRSSNSQWLGGVKVRPTQLQPAQTFSLYQCPGLNRASVDINGSNNWWYEFTVIMWRWGDNDDSHRELVLAFKFSTFLMKNNVWHERKINKEIHCWLGNFSNSETLTTGYWWIITDVILSCHRLISFWNKN